LKKFRKETLTKHVKTISNKKVNVGFYLINFLGRDMKTITLNNPITVDGISVSELTIRRPKVRDYLAMERFGGSDLSKEVVLTANLTSTAKEAIEELYLDDYVKVQEVLKDFFSPIIQKT